MEPIQDPIKRKFRTAKGVYEIPDTEIGSFTKDFPDAQEVKTYTVGDVKYDIPLGEEAAFMQDFPAATTLSVSQPKQLPTNKTELDAMAELLPWAEVRKQQLERSLPKFTSQDEANKYLTQANVAFKQEQQEKLAKLLTKYQLPLPNTNEKTLAPRQSKSILAMIPFVGNTLQYGANALGRGFYQAQTADLLNSYKDQGSLTAEDTQKIAEYQKQLAQHTSSDAYKQFTESDSVIDAAKAFASDPVTILTELMTESMTAQLVHGLPRMAGGGAMGAAIGAPTGVGVAPGAAIGALAALPATSLNLEFSGKILESLGEMGVNTQDGEDILLAFSDPDKVDQLRDLAHKKAIPIAAIDALSVGLAGKFYSAALKRGTSKSIAGLKELGTQMTTGGAGEAAGQAASGEDFHVGSILSEMVGEIGSGAVETAAGVKARTMQAASQEIASQLDPKIAELQSQAFSEVKAEFAQPVAKEETTTETTTIPTVESETVTPDVELTPEQLKTNLQAAIQKVDNARIAASPNGRLSVERTKISVDEMAALKDQIRLEARAAREGVKEANVAKQAAVEQITTSLEGLRLPAAKQATVLNRIGKVNFLNTLQVARLTNYVEKVALDTVYADKVQQAESIQGSIKSRLNVFTPEQRDSIKQFLAFKVDDVTNVDEYIAVANKINNSSKPPDSDNYAPLITEDVAKYVAAEKPKIEEFIEANLEQLPTDAELTGPNVPIKLGQMAVDRVSKLTNLLGNTKIAGKIKNALNDVDTKNLKPKQLRDFVRSVDTILANEDYGNSAQIAAEIYAANNSEKIEAPAAALWKSANVLLGGNMSQMSTYLNRLYGNDAKAADFQNYSNINNAYGASSQADGLTDTFVKAWEKVAGIRGFNHEGHVLLSQFNELMQYEDGLTPQQGFDLAKANIVKGLETAKQYGFDDLKTEQAAWEKLNKFNTPKEAEAYIKAKHPNLYSQWKFLVKEHEAIEADLAANKEAMYGEKFVKVHNYIPLRVLNLSNESEVAIEDVSEVNRLTNPNFALKPKAAPTTITRVSTLPDGKIRDRRLFNVVSDRYAKSVFDIEASFEFLKATKTLNAARKKIAPTQIISSYNKGVEKLRGVPIQTSEAEQIAAKALTLTTEIAYTTALGGLFTGVLQFGTAMLNTLADLGIRGRDISLYFRPSTDSNLVHQQYTMGRRLSQMGGLSEIKQANQTVNTTLGKGLNKVFSGVEWVKGRAHPYVMGSQVYGDYFGARQAWNAFYLSKLKEQKVVVSNVDWKDEATRQNEPERKAAAAFAEQKVGFLLGESNVAKRAAFLTSQRVSDKLLKVTLLPFATYMINYKQKVANAMGKLASANAVEGAKELSILVAEATAVAMVFRPIMTALQGQLSTAIRDWMDYPADEDDKEKKEEMAYKLRVQNLQKDLMPWAVNNWLGDRTLEGLNYVSYSMDDSDESYKDWLQAALEEEPLPKTWAPYVLYEQPITQQLGMLGIFLEQVSGVKDVVNVTMVEEDTIMLTDRYGNEKEVYLDERTRKVLEFHGLLSMLAMAGINLREVKNTANQMKTQIIKEN